MIKRLWGAILVIVLVLFFAAGCTLPFWSELIGKWVYSSGGETATMNIETNSLTISMTGSMTGSMEFSLDEVDETAKHILMTVTSVTGDFAGGSGPAIGSVTYMTYSISGKNLSMSMGDTGYPATANTGPFVKQ